MRQLSLHASALNDAEYDLYTTSLTDLDDSGEDSASTSKDATHDDAYYEGMKIGVREVRGWMRGRYANVSPANIDAILRFFSPNLSQADTLTGGEFFAALRLVVHVENGRDVDRGLAFVQAHPNSNSTPARQSSPERVTPRQLVTTAPARPHNNPFSQHPQHDVPPKPQSSHGPHNPFVNRSTKPHPDELPKLPPLPPRKPPPPPPPSLHIISTQSQTQSQPNPNPFPNPILLPPPRHNSTLNPTTTKAGLVTSTLMKQSLQASKAAQTMKRAESQLEKERVLQVLKSSSVVSGGYSLAGAHITRSSIVVGASIQNRSNTNTNAGPNAGTNTNQNPNPNRSPSPAARLAYGHRRYESSSVDSGSSASASASASEAPPLPRRRAQTHGRSLQQRQQQQPSPPGSVSSLEQVALASSSPARTPRPPSSTSSNPYHRALPSSMAVHTSTFTTSTLYSSPHSSTTDLPPGRPPTHPDRKPYFPHSHSQSQSTHTHPDSDQNPSQDITVPDSFNNNPTSIPNTANTTTTTASSYTTAFALSPFQTPENSPRARIFRSKSLHHAPPPPPPARRSRPGSAQVGGNVFGDHAGVGVSGGGEDADVDDDVDADGDGGGMDIAAEKRKPGSTLSRHTSLSMPGANPNAGVVGHRRSSLSLSASSSSHTARTSYSQPPSSHAHSHYTHTHTRSESPFSNILATLQPKLDKARYKAEAGLSRRGFVGPPGEGGGAHPDGHGEGEGRKGRSGRGPSSVLSGEEREEREELVVHGHTRDYGNYGDVNVNANGHYGYGYGYDAPGVDGVDGDNGNEGGKGSLNGVGGDAVLDSDDTGEDGDGEEGWRRGVKERWGAGVRDKDGLKLPAGEGWRPL